MWDISVMYKPICHNYFSKLLANFKMTYYITSYFSCLCTKIAFLCAAFALVTRCFSHLILKTHMNRTDMNKNWTGRCESTVCDSIHWSILHLSAPNHHNRSHYSITTGHSQYIPMRYCCQALAVLPHLCEKWIKSRLISHMRARP